jgi:hypothetical protein
MAIYYFQETCTSLPTYKIEAGSLEEAYAEYQSGKLDYDSEEVQENCLASVFDDKGDEIEFPETWQ